MPIQTYGKLKCLRCKHVWEKRKQGAPIRCPKCTSPYWNKPK